MKDMSVSSYEGCGRHDHLGLVVKNDKYIAIAAHKFPAPANPGTTATIVVGMTAAQIRETNQACTKATRVYRTYHNVDQAFKKMIIGAFQNPFLNALSDEFIGCTNCTSLQFVSHLLTYYGMIAPTELTQNEHGEEPKYVLKFISVMWGVLVPVNRYLINLSMCALCLKWKYVHTKGVRSDADTEYKSLYVLMYIRTMFGWMNNHGIR
jgi:hypothetical protein